MANPTYTTQIVALPLAVSSLTSVTLKAGDTGPSRMVQLTDAQGRPFAIPGGAVVNYHLQQQAQPGVVNPPSPPTPISASAVIVAALIGVVQFDFTSEVPVPEAGLYAEEWQVDASGVGGPIVTFPGDGYVPVTVISVVQ